MAKLRGSFQIHRPSGDLSEHNTRDISICTDSEVFSPVDAAGLDAIDPKQNFFKSGFVKCRSPCGRFDKKGQSMQANNLMSCPLAVNNSTNTNVKEPTILLKDKAVAPSSQQLHQLLTSEITTPVTMDISTYHSIRQSALISNPKPRSVLLTSPSRPQSLPKKVVSFSPNLIYFHYNSPN